MKSMLLLACVLAWSTAATASAVLIDFETTPAGGVPTDDGVLPFGTPYVFPGVSIAFGFDYDTDGVVDADPLFEKTGTYSGEIPNSGFSGAHGFDTPDPNAAVQLGGWFLRSPNPGSDFGHFIIKYVSSSGPVVAASGEIWDIDGTTAQGYTEEYTVQAYDAGSNLLATQVSPLGVLDTPNAPLDGQPWAFNFTGLTAGIDTIVIDFTGTKPGGIGLAFNNFYPRNAVPEPATALSAGLAAVCLLMRRRKVV